jgi:hypothetical protein
VRPPARAGDPTATRYSPLATAAHINPPARPERKLMAKQAKARTPRTAIANVQVSDHEIFLDQKLERSHVCVRASPEVREMKFPPLMIFARQHKGGAGLQVRQQQTSKFPTTKSFATRNSKDSHVCVRASPSVRVLKSSARERVTESQAAEPNRIPLPQARPLGQGSWRAKIGSSGSKSLKAVSLFPELCSPARACQRLLAHIRSPAA